ncbi:MAG: TerB family tellurite resistance protein [Oscillospiraceae bacterium]|nr:TerB family tellurite resistance protein [Oscillospiraceae bacterium]
MSKIQEYAESFKLKYERFLIGCDAVQEEGDWSTENLGDMGAYYTRELLIMILRIITADGWVSQKEVDYLNEFFGFTYTQKELDKALDGLDSPLHSASNEKVIIDSMKLLRSINPRLAASFRELVLLSCGIMSMSDGIVTDEEKEEIAKLRALVE